MVGNWHPQSRVTPKAASDISRYIPFITRLGQSSWADDRTGEKYSFQDIVEKFSDLVPSGSLNIVSETEPKEINEIISAVECRLIETQRLLIIGPDRAPVWQEYGRARGPSRESKLVVEQKARTLRRLLQDKLAEFGTVSQRLDRSFPRRVINAGMKNIESQSKITEDLQRLEDERSALTKVGLIDTQVDQVVIPEQFDKDLTSVLSIYIRDTAEKLNVFVDLRQKIDLFVEIINDRFSGKSIEINQKEGFIIRSLNSGKEIPRDKLSSGEQHQLVLVFDLLFELKKDSFILIDEPELSLHVRWQKKFISDLQRIIQLNHFDVLLATHSPQLISHWREFIVTLGSVHRK